MLLLLLLSCFSHVRLCATPETAAHQAPLSLGFSKQEHWLEWVAIFFSNACKWKVKVKSLSRVRLLATPWTAAYQAPPSMGFSKQEYWSGVPLPSPKLVWACHKTHWKLSWEERRGIWHQKTKRGPWCSYDSIKFDIMGIGERLSY